MNNTNNILLLGLPESGKTSFLAAFVNYIDAIIENKTLNQYKLSSNTQYITSIVQNWLIGKSAERTKITASENSTTEADLFIEDISTGQKFTLHIPDFYGEIFENQFLDRLIEASYVEHIKASSGLLLFIHPERVRHPILIEDMKDAYMMAAALDREFEINFEQEENGQQTLDGDNSQEINNEATSFAIEESPTQLVLVDLLEVHLEYCEITPINLVVIISAWDLVNKNSPELSPMKWIEKTMPLLYQFLLTNNEKIDFKCIGISAQGGDVKDVDEVKRLTSLHEPTDRIIVRDENVINKNIALPIEWILNQWQK